MESEHKHDAKADEKQSSETHKMQMGGKMMYGHLALETAISAVIMYLVMFVMIDRLGSFYNNVNMFYMTLMMVAPMVVIMLVGSMRSMFPNKRLNYILVAVLAAVFFVSWSFIRWQYPIGNTQFLRSMIPHHSGAILMCQESELTDPEIIKLCDDIIKGQKQEIDQMKAILERSK